MFERFTKEARAVVLGAQEVARDTDTRAIDSRHLLVALIEHPGSAQRAVRKQDADVAALAASARADLGAGAIDAEALAGIGIDLDAVRREADAMFGTGALERAGRKGQGHIPFAPDAKKALELALREAIRLKQKQIDSAHLLLGIVRAESPGRTLLVRAGVDIDSLRTALEEQTRAA
jgi:ATP-dependent Clp protease ATP-binding subunit ClpA